MRLWLRLGIAALIVAAAPAVAPAEDNAAPKRGLLLKMENGDVSCYLHLQPEPGRIAIVHADFDLCQLTDLIGSKVVLTYEKAAVMAARCEGDPDCPYSDVVTLAVAMTHAER